jgi:hypothetical protein
MGRVFHAPGSSLVTTSPHERTSPNDRLSTVLWMPYDQMSRLEQKMFWAVRESAMLHELPVPEVDNPGSASEVRWAAEEPADCARVLLGWLDAGLVGVMSTDEERELPSADAREVLAKYAAGSPAYSLVLTDAGEFGLA